MGRHPYNYTDSEETEDASSSAETMKKKKRFSILKYTNGNVKKKKCKLHSRSDTDDTLELRRRSSSRIKKLRGILKHDRESSEEDEEISLPPPRPKGRYLVGRVPRPPGRGGGVALIVRKNTAFKGIRGLQAQSSTTSNKRQRFRV